MNRFQAAWRAGPTASPGAWRRRGRRCAHATIERRPGSGTAVLRWLGRGACSRCSWWLMNPALRVLSRRSGCRHQAFVRPISACSMPGTKEVDDASFRRHGSIARLARAATIRAPSRAAGTSLRAASPAAVRYRAGCKRRRYLGTRPWIRATTNPTREGRRFGLCRRRHIRSQPAWSSSYGRSSECAEKRASAAHGSSRYCAWSTRDATTREGGAVLSSCG